jgi:hypothetical protein
MWRSEQICTEIVRVGADSGGEGASQFIAYTGINSQRERERERERRGR